MIKQPRLPWLELRSSPPKTDQRVENEPHVAGDRLPDAAALALGRELCQRERSPSGGKHSIRGPLRLLAFSHELFWPPIVSRLRRQYCPREQRDQDCENAHSSAT
jgi:hypothetical protein